MKHDQEYYTHQPQNVDPIDLITYKPTACGLTDEYKRNF